jgi:hypothetical protein
VNPDESQRLAVPISRVTAEKLKRNPQDVLGAETRCDQLTARCRMLVLFPMREMTDLSFPAIGRLFNRDHSTVVRDCQLIERECARRYTARRSWSKTCDHRNKRGFLQPTRFLVQALSLFLSQPTPKFHCQLRRNLHNDCRESVRKFKVFPDLSGGPLPRIVRLTKSSVDLG